MRFLAILAFVPALAMGADFSDLSDLQNRVKSLEERFTLLERDVDNLKGGQTAKAPCPCLTGGDCTCGEDCDCPLCLEHLTNAKAVEIYAAHEAEISKIWAGLSRVNEWATMRHAVEVWIKQQHAKNNGLESATAKPPLRAAYEAEVEALTQLRESMQVECEPAETIARKLHAARREIGERYKNLTPVELREKIYARNEAVYGDPLGPTIDWLRGKGKTWEQIAASASEPGDWPPKEMARVLFFTADWCVHCGPAKDRLGDLINQVEIVDCTNGNPTEYQVSAYPTCILLDDAGKIKKRCVGEHIGKLIVGGWLDSAPSQTPAVSPEKSIQDSRVEKPTRTVYHDDGDASDDQIRQHLVDAHGYSWSQVSGMSRSQLKAAHDRGHGGPARVAKNYPVWRQYQPTIRYTQPAQYRPTQSSGFCPNCR